MSTSLEPRQVEPGALVRWAREASELLLRSPVMFLVSAAFFGGLGLFVERSTLAQAALGLWALVHYQQAANRADRGELRFSSLPEYLLASLFETVTHLRRCAWSTGVSLSMLAFACWMTGSNIVYQAPPPELAADAPHELLGLAGAHCVGVLMLMCGKGFVGFAYLLGRLCDGDFARMVSMSRQARDRNRKVAALFDISMLASLYLCTWVTPLSLVVGPLAGTLVYVGFRDVFLHGTGNRRLSTSAAPSRALAGGTA